MKRPLLWIGFLVFCGVAVATSPLTIDRQEIKEAIHERQRARDAASQPGATLAQQVDYQRACERADAVIASTKWKWGKGNLDSFIFLEDLRAMKEGMDRSEAGQ